MAHLAQTLLGGGRRDRAMQLQRDGFWGTLPSLVGVTGVAVEIEGRVEPFTSVETLAAVVV